MHVNWRLAQALHGLSALTELNLRRNAIASVSALEALPSLQRLFLSNNAVAALSAIACLGAVPTLLELALDGNPYAAEPSYRHATLELCRIEPSVPDLLSCEACLSLGLHFKTPALLLS